MQYIERTLGWLFYNFKIGDEKALFNLLGLKDKPQQIKVTSKTFTDNGYLPIECAGAGVGDNKSPALTIELLNKSDIPKVKSFILICQDIDVPVWFPIPHLVVYNIDPTTTDFELDEFNGENNDKFIYGSEIRNKKMYLGPQPIRGHGDHRYVFQFLAVNDIATEALKQVPANVKVTTEKVIELVTGNVIAHGSITGLYIRE